MTARAEKLKVLERAGVTSDVIDLCSRSAAGTARAAIAKDHRFANRFRESSRARIVASSENMGHLDLQSVQHIRLRRATVHDARAEVPDVLRLVAAEIGAEEFRLAQIMTAIHALERQREQRQVFGRKL